jgi:hypothetical protein
VTEEEGWMLNSIMSCCYGCIVDKEKNVSAENIAAFGFLIFFGLPRRQEQKKGKNDSSYISRLVRGSTELNVYKLEDRRCTVDNSRTRGSDKVAES